MKVLTFNHTEYTAEKIVKTDDSIIGYNNDSATFKFSGITNFDEFTLDDGQEFDAPEPSEIDKLRIEQAQANAELVQLIMMMGGA